MDYLATAWQNIQIGWWVAVLWFVGFNGTGKLLKPRARYLPDNWITAIDKKIPFFPYGFDAVYLLGYVLPFYPLLFVESKTQAWAVMFGYALTLMLSFLIFMFYPVKMKQHKHNPKTPLMKFIYAYAPNSNCLPSVHCSYATLPFLAALIAHRPEAPIVGLVGLAVIVSTVFTKQHWAVDCLAGIAVAVFSMGFMYGLFFLL